jgi:uncharacterized protein (TIGR02270 family)
MNVIPAVVYQHAADAAILCASRRAAISSAQNGLPRLASLDDRIEAHLDGLRIAEDEGWRVCEEQLKTKEEGEVFTAGVIAFESGKADRIAKILSVVEEEPKTLDGLVSALGWLPLERARPYIQTSLHSEKPLHQQLGIAGAAIQRWHPGEALARLLRSENSGVRTRALRAVGELGDSNLARSVESALVDVDEECRFAAAWSGALLGISAAVPVLREIGSSDSPRASVAASLALRKMDLPAAHAWQKWLSENPKTIRLGVISAGWIGDPVLVPWLVSLMNRPWLARVAAEAFSTITGVDLSQQHIEGKPPKDFAAGPTDNPDDEDVTMDPDEDLPWPEATLVQEWWNQNRGQFQAGTRHLLGKPMSVDWLKMVLRDGRQRQRAAAALELALCQPGQPVFNVKAPGFRQQKILGKNKPGG